MEELEDAILASYLSNHLSMEIKDSNIYIINQKEKNKINNNSSDLESFMQSIIRKKKVN